MLYGLHFPYILGESVKCRMHRLEWRLERYLNELSNEILFEKTLTVYGLH